MRVCAELAVGAQALGQLDAVEALGAEVDDEHLGAVGVRAVGPAGQPGLVAGRAQHPEHVGAEQQVVEDGEDAGHARYWARSLRNSWRTDSRRGPTSA